MKHIFLITLGKFEGLIGNHPGLVKNVKFGQQWSVKENEISDWMYVKSEMIHGGFTIDPLLDSYPKEQADAFSKKISSLATTFKKSQSDSHQKHQLKSHPFQPKCCELASVGYA